MYFGEIYFLLWNFYCRLLLSWELGCWFYWPIGSSVRDASCYLLMGKMENGDTQPSEWGHSFPPVSWTVLIVSDGKRGKCLWCEKN